MRSTGVPHSSREIFRVWDSDSLWDGGFEKAWHPIFSPDGRLRVLVRINDQWNAIAVDGDLSEQRSEFALDPVFSRDGSVVTVRMKDNMQYTVAVNRQRSEKSFHSSRGLAVSSDGGAMVPR